MSSTEWETIEVPRGAYISWGNKPGQHVTGKVFDYDLTGGTDFNGKPCPQLSIELTEEASSINKDNERTRIDAGELVVINVGQVSLKRAMRAADPQPGDLLKVTLSNLVKVPNGTVKEFDVKIARGVEREDSAAATGRGTGVGELRGRAAVLMPTDKRVVYGARCTWWGPINEVARTPGGLPCCPHCGGVLFEVPSEAEWWASVDEHALKEPGYRELVEWLREHHFANFQQARQAWDSNPSRN